MPEFDPNTFAQQLLQAAADKNGFLILALCLLGAVFLAKRFAGTKIPFLATHTGSAVLTIAGSVAAALVTALAAGTPMGLPVLLSALKVAGPTIAALLFSAFHDPEAAKAKAVEAGQAAAKATPAGGAENL